jgi:type VI secretion system protein ImpK
MLELEGIRDSLYRQIRQLRGDVSRDISPHWEGLPETRKRLVRIVPWWLITLFTLICLGVIYGVFTWMLDEQRASAIAPFQSSAQNSQAIDSPAPAFDSNPLSEMN